MTLRAEYSEAKAKPNPGQADLFERGRRRFLRKFPGGFRDETYLDWERNYKWEAHQEWAATLNEHDFRQALRQERYQDIASRAVKIESGRSLLFSFEKMALRDAVRSDSGAKTFSEGLFAFLYGKKPMALRFAEWVSAIEALPRKQTRVLTWPLATVFGFIAQPGVHIFLKPNTTKEAAKVLGFPFAYKPRPNWATYKEYLDLAEVTRKRLRDLGPRDMIDIQSFLWVLGSSEYR